MMFTFCNDNSFYGRCWSTWRKFKSIGRLHEAHWAQTKELKLKKYHRTNRLQFAATLVKCDQITNRKHGTPPLQASIEIEYFLILSFTKHLQKHNHTGKMKILNIMKLWWKIRLQLFSRFHHILPSNLVTYICIINPNPLVLCLQWAPSLIPLPHTTSVQILYDTRTGFW